MLNIFKDKNEVIKRALELAKQKAQIEQELKVLNPQVLQSLQEQKLKRFSVDGVGSVDIRTNIRKVLNTKVLGELLGQDQALLKVYVDSLSSPKQGALEKYIGTPKYNELIANTETSESIVFNVERNA